MRNKRIFSASDLEVYSIVKNTDILNKYSMRDLDALYKKHCGDYSQWYPAILAAKIKAYDTSDAVNSFLFKGKSLWLDKATRVGLMHLANCSTSEIQVVLGDEIITFPVEVAKQFLAKLEVYAGQCYLQTQKHLLEVSKLKTPEEIINYDYTTGYPEKITLE